ncbi:DNA-binding protein [Burkholderia cenocepacia]|uniref:DNA-binding protein n=1 Tax=Burkholderia cenocepacia TaxID=95486 RepID=UPI0007616CA6|nr:DNA-binding protein [Burkholderia cenocepacia]KWU17760.1 hypothetical protein AS149_13650 [Burkholderia cenocepacia]
MNTPEFATNRLQADVDALLAQGGETRALYREVCGLMFFRHGLTPTANKLYNLVRRGTMSTPAEALKQFWDELREKSRVRIERADVPEGVLAAAGELVAGLWRQATDAALESLASARAEAETAKREAARSVEAIRAELQRTEEALAHRTEGLLALQTRYQERDEEVAASRATHETMTARIAELEAESRALRQAQADDQKRFSAKLEEMATNAQRTEQRAEASEKRALMEIDRERTLATRLQKELDALRAQAQKATEQGVAREAALHGELDAARHRLTGQDTEMSLLREARERIEHEAQALRAEVIELKVRVATAESAARAASRDAAEQTASKPASGRALPAAESDATSSSDARRKSRPRPTKAAKTAKPRGLNQL